MLLNIGFCQDPLFHFDTWFQLQSDLKNVYEKVKTWLARWYSSGGSELEKGSDEAGTIGCAEEGKSQSPVSSEPF